MWEQIKYVQFHNIKFKMPESKLLLGIETSFKNGQKAQNVNSYCIFYIKSVPMVLSPAS